MPVTVTGGRAFFTDGALAYAGHYVHEAPMEDHTHSFVEIAVVRGDAVPVCGARSAPATSCSCARVWHRLREPAWSVH